jgi:hypothetical protein
MLGLCKHGTGCHPPHLLFLNSHPTPVLQVYLARVPRSAFVVFEVAPEVDVRRSTVDGAGERYMQYHDVIRVWVRGVVGGRGWSMRDCVCVCGGGGLPTLSAHLLWHGPLSTAHPMFACTSSC